MHISVKVAQRRGRGLVDDAHAREAADLDRVLGGLPLGIVEVGGDGDDGRLDLLACIILRLLLQVADDGAGDQLWGEC